MTRVGTSYFITFAAACRYYKDYYPGYTANDLARAVAGKIAEGEIHIGEPPLKPGEWRELTDNKTRYAVVSPD